MPREIFRYAILPARPPFEFALRDTYNRAYEYWRTYWQRMFRLKAADFFSPTEFFRQDLICCLFLGEEIVAQNLSTFVHLDNIITSELPYFQVFRGEVSAMLAARQTKTIMTIEYTSVNPRFGERRIGLRLGEIVNALALENFKSRDIDATVGTPRRLSGLGDLGVQQGYHRISAGIQKATWELDVCIGFKGEMKEHPDSEYRSIIRSVWHNRIDYSELTSAKDIDIRFKGATKFKMSSYIRNGYDDVMKGLCDKLDSMSWDDRPTYGLWLAQAYYLVRHTTRLLALCAGYCSFEQEEMHKRLLVHLEEEHAHDKIAAADLVALGYSIAAMPELSATRRLIQLQYDQLDHKSPCVFFGYILLLEGLAVMRGQQICDQVACYFGSRTGRFLKLHSDEDVEHVEKALQQVENLDPEHQSSILNNLRQSAGLYLAMLNEVEMSASQCAMETAESAAARVTLELV